MHAHNIKQLLHCLQSLLDSEQGSKLTMFQFPFSLQEQQMAQLVLYYTRDCQASL